MLNANITAVGLMQITSQVCFEFGERFQKRWVGWLGEGVVRWVGRLVSGRKSICFISGALK